MNKNPEKKVSKNSHDSAMNYVMFDKFQTKENIIEKVDKNSIVKWKFNFTPYLYQLYIGGFQSLTLNSRISNDNENILTQMMTSMHIENTLQESQHLGLNFV